MSPIVESAELQVLSLLNEKLPSGFLYHNFNHAQRVVKHVDELVKGENIPEPDAELIFIAAWFHDVGFIHTIQGHEEQSVREARLFLESENYPENKIRQVEELIRVTDMHMEPKNFLEKVICDADFSHFASKSYDETADLLREEFRQLGVHNYDDREWVMENIRMFNEHHRYHTQYAIANWQPQKSANLLSLLKRLKKLDERDSDRERKERESKWKNDKEKSPGRGIETMYRVTLRNHIALSSIADTKANILLSVNAIIISLALANLIPKLDNPTNYYLLWPTLIFLTFSLISITLSVIATRPNVTEGKFTRKDVEEKKANLLFFGNFHKMSIDEFQWAMDQLIQDKDYLYSSMSADLYYLGKVLNKKYKLLRITYSIFLTGIIVSVFSFVLFFKLSQP